MNSLICSVETSSLSKSDLLAKRTSQQFGSLYFFTSSIQKSFNSSNESFSVKSKTKITASAPRQYAETIDRKAQEPAVSQICNLTLFPLTTNDLNLKSTPMVESKLSDHSLSTNLIRRELLPTPELPAIMILNPESLLLIIINLLYL